MTHRTDIPKGDARKNSGFTLVETMLALLILVLLTGIVAMGIPVAFETYQKAVVGSNAQVLLSTTTTELRNELGLAQDVITDAGQGENGTVRYYLAGEGYWASIESPTPGSGQSLVKKVYSGYDASSIGGDPVSQPLVSSKAVTGELYVTIGEIKYADGVFIAEDIQVSSTNANIGVLAEVSEYKVKALMLNS